jgi:hypothetical protein
MDNIILYDGLYQAEVDEFAYAEAELVVASNYIDNLFFDLVRGFNDDTVLYGESDDDGAKQGFFKRIWAMFKKFWKAIIDFIKNVCRKVLEILAKPFGFKMNKANNSGGAGSGGGSSTRTDAPSSNSNVGTGDSSSWNSLKELTTLMNTTIAYIKTPKSVSKDDVSKEGILDTNLIKDSLNSKTSLAVYKANNITDNMSRLVTLAKKLNLFDNKDILDSLDSSSSNKTGADLDKVLKEARAHKNMNFKFEIAKPSDGNNPDEHIKRLIAYMDAAYRIVKNVMGCSGNVAAAMADIEKAKNDTEALSLCKDIYDTIIRNAKANTFQQIHGEVIAHINDEDKLFGMKAKEAVALSPVYYLYSFGKTNLHGLINEKDFLADIDSIPAVKNSSDFKAEAYDANMNLLKGEMLEKNVASIGLATVEIKPGYKINSMKFLGDKGSASSNSNGILSDRAFNGTMKFEDIAKSVLRENLKDMTQMKEEYELDDAKKNTLKDLKDAKHVSSNSVIQGLVTNASAILKSTVKNMTEITNLTVRVDNACVSTPYIFQSVHIANAMLIYWDKLCYAKDFILKELDNNKALKDDLGDGVEKEKTELLQDFKSLGNTLSTIFRQKYGD